MTNPMETDLVIRAKKFAMEQHSGQMYGGGDGLTMGYHLEMVAQRALQWGCTAPGVISACYLHDVLEDTDATYEDLVNEFDYNIASIVHDVTDEEGGNRFERWLKTAPKIRSNASSIFVKLCDRHSNMTQSLKTKHSTLGMYVKEYPIFKASLYDPWKWATEWGELDEVYKLCKDANAK